MTSYKYNEDEKRKIIMDYYMNKRNRVDLFNNSKYKKVYIHSSACVDEMNLFYNKDNNDIKMVSKGCAIFLSSCEIFVEQLNVIGFDKKDLLVSLFTKLVNQEKLSDDERQMLGKLNIYENVARHLNRKECALLITKAIAMI